MDFPDRFTKARLDLLKHYPFFGQMAMYLHLIEDKNIPTTAVNAKGHFIYNPEHVETLNHQDLVFEIAHEIGHLFTRTMDRFPPGAIFPIWNKASDVVIDTLLKDSGLPQSWISTECTTKELMKKYREKTTMEVYLDMIKNGMGGGCKDPQACGNNCQGNCQADGQGGGDQGTPDKRKCKGGSSTGEATKAEVVEWKQRAQAAAEAAKARGKLPGILSDLILELLEPTIHWTDYLRVKTQECMKRRWTWRIPGRRGEGMGIRLPGKHPDLPTAVCAIDTSGSIGNGELQRFISESAEILRLTGGKVRLILFDAEVYFDEDVDDFKTGVTKFQRGGTDFQAVFDHIDTSDKKRPQLLVFFTDLYAPYPREAPAFPVVWALTPDHATEPVPFGETVETDIHPS